MKQKYKMSQQLMAFILLASLFLQSCVNSLNPVIPTPIQEVPLEHTSSLINHIQPLIGQELTAQGEHAVTFYEEAGQLKANVIVNAPQGFSKTYEGLSVTVEQGAELAKLPRLNAKAQERRIHLQLAKGKHPAKIVIYKDTGLIGGSGKGKEKVKDNINKVAESDIEQEQKYNKPKEEIEQKVKTKAVTYFTDKDHDFREFGTLYDTHVLQNLLNLSHYPHVLQYVFNYAEDSGDFIKFFQDQFAAMYRLQKELNRTSCFICIEPAKMNTSHFILGVCEGKNLLLVNPLGLTKHKEFYQNIKELTDLHGIQNIYISNTIIQNDPNAIVSCGTICAELCTHIASLDKPSDTGITSSVFDQLKIKLESQIKNDQNKKTTKNLVYTPVDITSLLPDTLKGLATVKESGEDYIAQLTKIRENHLQSLEKRDMNEEQNAEQSLLFRIAFDEESLENLKQDPEYKKIEDRKNLSPNIPSSNTDPSTKDLTSVLPTSIQEKVDYNSQVNSSVTSDRESKHQLVQIKQPTPLNVLALNKSAKLLKSKSSEEIDEILNEAKCNIDLSTILKREALLRKYSYELLEVHGKTHVRTITFQKNLTQQVAPHLDGLGTWEDIPEFVVITGKNGAGKSQLLKYIERMLRTYNSTINVLFRGPDYNNGHVAYNFDTKRDTNYFIENSDQRKALIADIIEYYRTGKPSYRWQDSNVYRDIIAQIEKVLGPQFPKGQKPFRYPPRSIAARLVESDTNEIWEQEIGKLIDSHRDYCSENHNVNTPLSALGEIFNTYEKRVKALLNQYRQFEYLNTLFEFYCKQTAEEQESVNSYRNFIKDIQNKEFIDNLIKIYIEKELRILSPCDEANKILARKEYNFPYKLTFTSNGGYKEIVLEKEVVKGDNKVTIPVSPSLLSSGEKMLLDLMSWLFYFQGVSAKGEDPAQVQKVDIMLLDEPDRHLDPDLCKMLYTFLHDEFVKKKHIQVFITTHRLDTVISAPKNSIYTMGEKSLEHDKKTAVSRMSRNIIERAPSLRSALSILSGGKPIIKDDINYVLAENIDDVKFYNIVHQKFLAAIPTTYYRTELIFMPVGVNFKSFVNQAKSIVACFDTMIEMLKSNHSHEAAQFEQLLTTSQDLINLLNERVDMGGGCGQIKKKVNEITLYRGQYDEKGKVLPNGNLQELKDKHRSQVMWAMIDNDDATKEGKTNARGNVHAIEEVYSFENYLCMPLNLFYYYLKNQEAAQSLPDDIKSMLKGFKEEEAKENDLQKISNSIIEYLADINQKSGNPIEEFTEDDLLEENKALVSLVGGYNIKYPRAFLINQGHDLLKGVSTIILGKEDQAEMRRLLFLTLEEIPVKFLSKKLQASLECLQNSEIASSNDSLKKIERRPKSIAKKVDYSVILEAIITYLGSQLKSELDKIRESKNNEEEITLVLPGIKKNDVINFCEKQLQMKKGQVRSGKSNTFTLSLNTRDQIEALQKVIEEMLKKNSGLSDVLSQKKRTGINKPK